MRLLTRGRAQRYLMWVFTVCIDMSVRILRVNKVPFILIKQFRYFLCWQAHDFNTMSSQGRSNVMTLYKRYVPARMDDTDPLRKNAYSNI